MLLDFCDDDDWGLVQALVECNQHVRELRLRRGSIGCRRRFVLSAGDRASIRRVSGSIVTLFDESPGGIQTRVRAMHGRGLEVAESFEQDSTRTGCIWRCRSRIASLLESPLFHGDST
ncbi:hypothetical protein [Burkholderia ambifaria]|uniref:hypothetical protein n=1 Tax=Burkholderia ambifaria TaxID=152480 RepID=UPI003BB6565E